VTRDLIARFYIMAPWKTPKTTGENSCQGSYIIFDTSHRSINTFKTWMLVSNVLQLELINYLGDSSDNEKDALSNKYKVVSHSEIHKIAARS